MIERRELEILFERNASLVCELEAYLDAPDGRVLRRSVGSGVFVAPCQLLTAKHVVTDMHNVNKDWADDLRRETSRYRLLPYFASAAQIADIRSPNVSLFWGFTNVWPNPLSDLALVQVAPDNEATIEKMNGMSHLFPTWSLLPPPLGETVVMFGQPRDSTSGNDQSDTLTYRGQPATVTEVHDRMRDRGMYSFPCFVVDYEVPHGMSGGPVYWNGKLCGVVSGGWDGHTVVAALWPACLIEFENPKLGSLNKKVTFESLFESNQIRADDWHLIKGNVSYDVIDGRQVPRLRSPEAPPEFS
jgi:hypothetical protein